MVQSSLSHRSNSLKTKKRLLSATEKLFASRGFAGVTMREVAHRAQTNIASAHYHFGSKEAMVMAMLKNIIEPINSNRLEYLNEFKKLASHRPLTVKEIFRALILPVCNEIAKSSTSQENLAQLVARSFTEPVKFIERLHKRFFSELSEKYSMSRSASKWQRVILLPILRQMGGFDSAGGTTTAHRELTLGSYCAFKLHSSRTEAMQVVRR